MHIGVFFIPGLAAVANDFMTATADAEIEVETEVQEAGVFASVEWWLPTAFIILLTRKYFDTLASEAAKEHYPIIRDAIRDVFRRLAGAGRSFRFSPIVSKQGPQKVTSKELDGVSIIAELASGQRVKFLVPFDLPVEQHQAAIDAIHRTMLDHYRQYPADGLSAAITGQRQRPGGQILARYDASTDTWAPWLPVLPPKAV